LTSPAASGILRTIFGRRQTVRRAALANVRWSLLTTVVAVVLASIPMMDTAHAQPDVVESARSLCEQAKQIWETHDQWAIRQLSTIYHEVFSEMSSEQFDEWIKTTYSTWAAAFGIEQACDRDVLTHAASGVTRQRWEIFNRCLQGGIDSRRAAVETFVREHQTLAQERMIGSFNATMAEASQSFLVATAQGAGLRTCRP
jgi:hypothetical protein